jgi:xanthine dehydrogenase accessory factor
MIRGELAKLAQEELIPGGVPFVEATVVRAQSPSSVRAGDAAIVRSDGTIEGFVGGACAEASVRLHALRVLETGEPLLLRILPGEAEGEPAAAGGSVMVRNPCLSGGGLEIFLEPRLPAATLRVVGQSPIALALADLGRRLGFAVELIAPGEGDAPADDAALVVASHGHGEERILTEALREGVPYVGLVASRIRGEAVRGSLDLPEELRAQLRTPAGLEIGAETPEEIALAILAEIVAQRRSREDAGGGRSIAATATERGGGGQARTATANPPVTPIEVALDPVCGMEVAVSESSIQLERDGERHYFCSEGCRDSFAAEGAPDSGVG